LPAPSMWEQRPRKPTAVFRVARRCRRRRFMRDGYFSAPKCLTRGLLATEHRPAVLPPLGLQLDDGDRMRERALAMLASFRVPRRHPEERGRCVNATSQAAVRTHVLRDDWLLGLPGGWMCGYPTKNGRRLRRIMRADCQIRRQQWGTTRRPRTAKVTLKDARSIEAEFRTMPKDPL